MYKNMKKGILVLLLSLIAASLSAEKTAEVNLRFGRQEGSVRIVLEAPDDMIKNANTITSLTSVKIEFPYAPVIRKQKDFLFETSHKDRFLVISLKEVTDVKTYKLQAPSRIVIDLKTAPKPQTESAPKPAAQGPQTPAAGPAPQLQAPDQKESAAADAQKTPSSPAQTGQQKPAETPRPSAQAPERRKIRTVVIDPGHGGFDQGVVLNDIREKELSLSIAKDLSAALAKKGMTVYLTRKTDQPFSLSERIAFITSKKPDLFISLHAAPAAHYTLYISSAEDINTDTAIKLYSVASRQARHLEKSRSLARALGSAIRNDSKGTVVLRELPLPLLYSIDAPSVIVEYPLSPTVTFDQKMRDRLTKALLSGMASYDE